MTSLLKMCLHWILQYLIILPFSSIWTWLNHHFQGKNFAFASFATWHFRHDLLSSPLLSQPASTIQEHRSQYDVVLSTLLDNHALLNTALKRRLERRWRKFQLEVDRQKYLDHCKRLKDLIYSTKMDYYSVKMQVTIKRLSCSRNRSCNTSYSLGKSTQLRLHYCWACKQFRWILYW